MQVTLGTLYNGWQALAKLSNLDLPARKAYALARFMKDAGNEYELIEKQRVKLVERYGAPDESGNTHVPPANLEPFVTAFNELLSVSVEVYDPQITIDDLDGAKLSAIAFFSLSWLFDRDEAATAPPTLDGDTAHAALAN